MTRVLILSVSYGSGHNIAARSLVAAFAEAGATVRVGAASFTARSSARSPSRICSSDSGAA